jgi:CubicO group peptidase (beta-lactamase class C family)
MSLFIRKIAIHSLVGIGFLFLAPTQGLSADSKSDTPPSQPTPTTSGFSIASAIQPFVDHHQIAGAVLLVATKDRVLTCDAVGFSDLSAQKAMATDQLFAIASMSKPIAITTLMMLVDEGKVSVDDPVEKYLPEFKNQMFIAEKDAGHVLLKNPKQPLLVRHLLTHTGGILYSGPLEKPSLDGFPLRTIVAEHAMLPLQFEPGSRYMYSSAGISTVARIVEVVSGEPYEKFLQEKLLTPLGMSDTTFWPTVAQLTRLAKCYKTNAARTDLIETQLDDRFSFPLSDTVHRYPMPGVGLFSTASDMLRFCQMYLNGGVSNGERYLSEASIALMTKKETPDNVKNSYGFGWAINKDGSYDHGGSFNTSMKINPKLDLITIFLTQVAGRSVKGGEKAKPAFETAAKKLVPDLR